GVAGDEAVLHCSHGQADHRVMLWYQQRPGDNAVKLIGHGYTVFRNDSAEEPFRKTFKLTGDLSDKTKSGVLSITKLDVREHTATYFCAASENTVTYTDPAYFGQGTKLTVLEPGRAVTKPTVRVLRPSPKECGKFKGRGKSKTIVCVASGFYPDHVGVQWTVDGLNISDGVATDDAARQEGKNYHITSRLRVSAKEFTKDRKFTCTVSFFNGKHTEYVSDFIHGEPGRPHSKLSLKTARFSYGYLIGKSGVFGVLVALLVWKLQVRCTGSPSPPR
uniref:Ig-like domain-containing protein n=1 Tax=Gasterosteus aculeatus aculeatus TaxID=481459 RepID=G3NNU1_GASAC